MAWQSETSEDESCIIHWNTSTEEVKIEDLVNEDTWFPPMDTEGYDEISSNIVPGFKNGKYLIMIGRIIKRILE